ncbi:hypothetical protein [Litorihabitans aurantiacus]|nr:hypothetical protein [Litorihabitans aurantiacus]
MPTVQGPQLVLGAIPGGAEQLMVRYYQDANHGIRVGSSTDPVVPAFLDGLATWMLDPRAAEEAGPAVAGATPRQIHLASAVPQPRWYADGEMMLRVPLISVGVAAGGLLVLAGGSVAAVLADRRRGRVGAAGADVSADSGGSDGPGGPGVSRETEVAAVVSAPTPRVGRGLAAFTVATAAVVVALVAYIVAVAQLALAYSGNGVVVWGGWVAVQALAVLSVWTGVRAVRRLLAHGRGRGRSGLVRAAGGWLAVGGLLGVLVVSAYWGAFSPLS